MVVMEECLLDFLQEMVDFLPGFLLEDPQEMLPIDQAEVEDLHQTGLQVHPAHIQQIHLEITETEMSVRR